MEWEMTDDEITNIIGTANNMDNLRKLATAAQDKVLNYQHDAWWSKYLRPYIKEMLNVSTKVCR